MTGPDERLGAGFVLGVDLGTSHTVAMLRWPDGRTRPVLFDGQPLLPSAVYLDTTGRLHVGRDALRLGYAEPGRFEPNPKRHIDDHTVLLGGAEVPVADMLAALLGAVAREAVAATGFLPPAVLTHPAAWGERRRAVLTEAITKAGWPGETQLLPEPVAAARYFADVLRRPVSVGSALAVFDFGGGTLDIAVVRNEGPAPDGRPRYVVAASGGADDLGGLDLDAALVDHLGKSLAGSEPEAWQALIEPVTLAQWRARRQFWEDVRGAKEMLSRAAFAPVPVPGIEDAVQLSREELEATAGPHIRRGVAEADSVIRAARLTPPELAGLFLVGGSTRVPLVARLLHSELGVGPTVLEQPELPVAEGAIVAVTGFAIPAPPHGEAAPPRGEVAPQRGEVAPAHGEVAPARGEAAAAAGPATADLPATEPGMDLLDDSGATPQAVQGGAKAQAVQDGAEAGQSGARSRPGGAQAGPGGVHAGSPWARPQQPAQVPAISPHPPTADTVPGEPSAEAPTSSVTRYPEPVDPWATGEAAAFGPAPTAAEPWLASTQPEPGRGIGDESAASGGGGRAYKKKLLWVLAAVVVVAVGVATTLVIVFWPKYPALDFHPLAEVKPIAPEGTPGTSFAAAAVRGDRAYFASADDNGLLGVVAADTKSGTRLWGNTAAGTAERWAQLLVTPDAIVAFSERQSETDDRRMVLLDPGNGVLLWETTIGSDDNVMFSGDIAVWVDNKAGRLVGLEVRNKGHVKWQSDNPVTEDGQKETAVVRSTTVADDSGPASAGGTALAASLDDDTRIVQIGADESAKVIDASTGTVLKSRQAVADPDDEVIAHNGRLIVAGSDDSNRIIEYDLDELGEPTVLYTAPDKDTRFSHLTACGADRVCFVATKNYEDDTAKVMAVDVINGGRLWEPNVPGAQILTPVGDAVLAAQNTSPPKVTLIDGKGGVVWTHDGEAARLDAGNMLLFSKALSTSPDDPLLSGQHLGDEPVLLGQLAGARSAICAWNTEIIACARDKDFMIQRFAA